MGEHTIEPEGGPDGETIPDGWQLEDSGPEAYERYLVPGMFAPWSDRLVDLVDLRPGERVLDVGCGTGIVARRAAARVGGDGSVVGLDPNEGMLEVAREASGTATGAIEWRVGNALYLPFAEDTFDVVFCQQALQFVPDPAVALDEIHRVLRPGGRMGLSLWRPIEFNPVYAIVADALEAHAGDEAGTMMRSPFSTWTLPELRERLRAAGFDDVTVTNEMETMRYPSVEELLRREAASSPLSGPLGDLAADLRGALVDDLEEALAGYVDDLGVAFPMESYVVLARR